MDGHWFAGRNALVSLQPRGMAVLLSLRHDLIAVDVPDCGRQRQADRDRGNAVRGLGRDQRTSCLALFVDERDSPLKTRLYVKKDVGPGAHGRSVIDRGRVT